MAKPHASTTLGVVVRKRRTGHRWAPWSWLPVAVAMGVNAEDAPWRVLRETEDETDYLAAVSAVDLFRTDTEAYRVALSNEPPMVYVVMRHEEDGPSPWRVFLVTVNAHDALDYLDSGEEIVEALPMPPALIAFVSDFVLEHHVEQPFKKRRRIPYEEAAPERLALGADASFLTPEQRKRRFN